MLKESLRGVAVSNGPGTPAWGDGESCPGGGWCSRKTAVFPSLNPMAYLRRDRGGGGHGLEPLLQRGHAAHSGGVIAPPPPLSRKVPPCIGHDPQAWEGSARHRAPPTSLVG